MSNTDTMKNNTKYNVTIIYKTIKVYPNSLNNIKKNIAVNNNTSCSTSPKHNKASKKRTKEINLLIRNK